MANIPEKISQIFTTAQDVLTKIFSWRKEKLDKSLHVKYDPNAKGAKSQWEAIMADVNEDPKSMKEAITLMQLAESFSSSDLASLGDIALNTKAETEKEISHRKKLKEEQENRSHFSKFSFFKNQK